MFVTFRFGDLQFIKVQPNAIMLDTYHKTSFADVVVFVQITCTGPVGGRGGRSAALPMRCCTHGPSRTVYFVFYIVYFIRIF